MQEDRRRQQGRPNVAPVDEPIESREFTGVTEGVEDERGQAENVEVANHGPRAAAREDEGSDRQVSNREQPLEVIDQRLFEPAGLDDQLGSEGGSAANEFVGGPAPDADAIESTRDIDTVPDRQAADAAQFVARLDAGALSGPCGRNLKRPGAPRSVGPPHAVVGQGKRPPLMVVHHGRPHQRDRGYHQQLGKNPGCKPWFHLYVCRRTSERRHTTRTGSVFLLARRLPNRAGRGLCKSLQNNHLPGRFRRTFSSNPYFGRIRCLDMWFHVEGHSCRPRSGRGGWPKAWVFSRAGGTHFSGSGVCLFPTKSLHNLLDDSPWTA